MKNNAGFTRMELIAVIIILIILAIAATPIYRKYINDSVLSEGRSLISVIQTAEKIYYAEFGRFYGTNNKAVESDETLKIDASKNSIFKKFAIKVSNNADPKTYEITVVGNKNGREIIINSNGIETSGQVEISSK
jgi:Tfp pilus assembly protein PilE